MKKKQNTKSNQKRRPLALNSLLEQIPIDFLTQNLNSPITIFDGNSDKLIYFNAPLCRLTGYTKEELHNISLREFLTYIHATDLGVVVNDIVDIVHAANKKYLKIKNQRVSFTMNYRFRKRDGDYVHVLVHNTVLDWNRSSQKMTTLNLYTDITNHKRDPIMHLKINAFDSSEQQWKTVYEEKFSPQPQMLSKHEKGIMLMMVDGKSAAQISEMLLMNYYTVRSHWRNILTKTRCKSYQELKALAQKEGWI